MNTTSVSETMLAAIRAASTEKWVVDHLAPRDNNPDLVCKAVGATLKKTLPDRFVVVVVFNYQYFPNPDVQGEDIAVLVHVDKAGKPTVVKWAAK